MAPTETPAPPQSPETAAPISTQDQNRQALYNQYYGQTGEPAPAEVVTPTPEPTAPVVPQSEPAPPPPVAQSPEYLEVLQSLRAELADMKAKLPAPPPPPPAPEVEAKWIPLLREGKIAEAEAAMAEAVAALNGPAITKAAIEQAVSQTREVMRAEAETTAYVTELRIANQDLLPMEPLIAAEAQRLMTAAQQKGNIKTTDDAIRTYKESVAEAVSSARKLYHRIRGEGNQEAQVRNREVLSSRPIPPQAVDTARPQATPGTPQETPVESPQDYLAKRTANQNRLKGLA